MVFLLVVSALAAPAGYTVTESNVDGCTLSLGPVEADGVVPMHAECWWPDVRIEAFRAKLADWTLHDDIWTAVVRSEVREAGPRALVWQIHQSKGIANREVLLWMRHDATGGADRYSWTLAGDRPLTPADGHVATLRDDGYWQAAPDPRGGVQVVHHLAYHPGGSVPSFVVRWFQSSGLKTNLAECHAAVR